MSENNIADSIDKVGLLLKDIHIELKKQNKKDIVYYSKYLHIVYAVFICVMLFISDKDHEAFLKMVKESYDILNINDD